MSFESRFIYWLFSIHLKRPQHMISWSLYSRVLYCFGFFPKLHIIAFNVFFLVFSLPKVRSKEIWMKRRDQVRNTDKAANFNQFLSFNRRFKWIMADYYGESSMYWMFMMNKRISDIVFVRKERSDNISRFSFMKFISFHSLPLASNFRYDCVIIL